MNIIDLIVISLLVFFAVRGYIKGFIKSVYSIISLIITYVILLLFKSILISNIAKSPIGKAIGELFVSNTDNSYIAEKISFVVIYIMSAILLYILIKFMLNMLLKILDKLSSLPLINTMNKTLGLITGIVFGIIWIAFTLNVLHVLPQTSLKVDNSILANLFKVFIVL